MMKKLYTLSALLLFATPLFAQVVLFENFEADTLEIFVTDPSGSDTVWIDFDYDGLDDQSDQERPGEWFLSPGFSTQDSANTVMASNSWTDVPDVPVANYLILPPITVPSAEGYVAWKYAPRQTPRFLDGLQVLVSTTGNLPEDFTDTLRVYAEYISGDAGVDTTFSNFQFSNGYVMGAHPEDYEYLEYANDSLRFIGILRPDSAGLENYAGQTIYIAFCHGTTDDNLVAIDDIKVSLSGQAMSVEPKQTNLALQLNAYPNPASEQFRLEYDMPYTAGVRLNVFDATGKMVKAVSNGTQIRGRYFFDVDTRDLPNGVYTAVLNTNKESSTVKIEVLR